LLSVLTAHQQRCGRQRRHPMPSWVPTSTAASSSHTKFIGHRRRVHRLPGVPGRQPSWAQYLPIVGPAHPTSPNVSRSVIQHRIRAPWRTTRRPGSPRNEHTVLVRSEGEQIVAGKTKH